MSIRGAATTRESHPGPAFIAPLLRILPVRGWLLFLSVLALTGLGLVVLLSAGQSGGARAGSYFGRQVLWVAVALGAGLGAFTVGVHRLRPFALPVGIVSLVLLAAVLVPSIGVEVNGARRWIDLGGQRVQPSELAKIGFVLVLTAYLAANLRRLGTWLYGAIIPGALIGLFCGLIVLEPDLGTTTLYAAVGGALLLAAGSRLHHLLTGALLALLLFVGFVLTDAERLQRVTTFMDPEGHRMDGAYQLWQGIVGIGAGGLTGVGSGNGRQHLDFLPEAHTDFIFAVVGEELGLVTTGTVVLLFSFVAFLVFLQLRRAPDTFQYLFVLGAALFLLGQAIINMGVVTGLFPTKGMSLPFISYGGSNLVTAYLLTGFILSAFRAWDRPVLKRVREL